MEPSRRENLYLRWDEAMALVRSEPDKTTRRMLRRLLGAQAEHHVKQDIGPVQPVDMMYLVQLARSVFRDHETLRAILEGRDAGEWFDNEDY